MTDALSILHACRDACSTGDYLTFLVAADYFGDEGNDPLFERALRFMAEHQIVPCSSFRPITYSSARQLSTISEFTIRDGTDTRIQCWQWLAHPLIPSRFSGFVFYSFTAALLALAESLPA